MHSRRRNLRGFTLLELMVVATLGTLVMIFITNASVWYSRTMKTMNVSAQLERELKLAAQAIAQDYGPALSVRTTDGADLQFDFDLDGDAAAQWENPDLVIEYTLQDGNLIRRNLATGDEVPLAAHIREFSAEMVSGQLNVHVVAGYRTTEQDVKLQLRDPT